MLFLWSWLSNQETEETPASNEMSENMTRNEKLQGISTIMWGLKVPEVILKAAGEIPGWPSRSIGGPVLAVLD